MLNAGLGKMVSVPLQNIHPDGGPFKTKKGKAALAVERAWAEPCHLWGRGAWWRSEGKAPFSSTQRPGLFVAGLVC